MLGKTERYKPRINNFNFSLLVLARQSHPLLPLEGVLKQDFKHAFNLNLTHGFFSSAKHKGESRSKTIG